MNFSQLIERTLVSKLKIKDNQIADLTEQIKQLNEHLRFANNLVDQSQCLNAAEKVKKLAEDTEKKKKIVSILVIKYISFFNLYTTNALKIINCGV